MAKVPHFHNVGPFCYFNTVVLEIPFASCLSGEQPQNEEEEEEKEEKVQQQEEMMDCQRWMSEGRCS